MAGGRAKLPVLAEISGPAGADRVWSLRSDDLARLGEVHGHLEGRRTVLVTGAEEAIRVLAVALAGVACAAGRSTVLLECDLARPRLAVDLGLAPAPGLHEYLRWEATPAEILQPLTLAGPAAAAEAEQLICIAAGREAADPVTLLGLQSFRHMVAKLRSAYDLLILGGPSVDSGRPSLGALAAESDGLLAAVSSEGVSRRAGRSLRAALAGLPAAALGAVVVES